MQKYCCMSKLQNSVQQHCRVLEMKVCYGSSILCKTEIIFGLLDGFLAFFCRVMHFNKGVVTSTYHTHVFILTCSAV